MHRMEGSVENENWAQFTENTQNGQRNRFLHEGRMSYSPSHRSNTSISPSHPKVPKSYNQLSQTMSSFANHPDDSFIRSNRTQYYPSTSNGQNEKTQRMPQKQSLLKQWEFDKSFKADLNPKEMKEIGLSSTIKAENMKFLSFEDFEIHRNAQKIQPKRKLNFKAGLLNFIHLVQEADSLDDLKVIADEISSKVSEEDDLEPLERQIHKLTIQVKSLQDRLEKQRQFYEEKIIEMEMNKESETRELIAKLSQQQKLSLNTSQKSLHVSKLSPMHRDRFLVNLPSTIRDNSVNLQLKL